MHGRTSLKCIKVLLESKKFIFNFKADHIINHVYSKRVDITDEINDILLFNFKADHVINRVYIRDEIKETLLLNYKFHRAHKKYYDKSRLNQFLLCVNAI